MKMQISQIFVFTVVAFAASTTMQAQFITANSQEAVGYGVALEQNHAAARSAAEFALANARTANGLSGGYDFSNVETDRSGTRLFEGDVDQSAFHLNYGHALGNLVASLQVSFFDTKAKSVYRDGGVTGDVELDSDGWFLASSLAYTWEGFNLNFLGGLGQLSNASTRTSAAIPNPKTGDFDSEFYTLGFVVDYKIYQQNAFTVTPRIGLNYSKVDTDSFDEQFVGGGFGDDGSLDSMDRDWLIGSLEVLLDWKANEQLGLQAILGWHYDFNHDTTTLSGVDNGGTPGGVAIPDVGESFFKGGLSADYAINEKWSLNANTSVHSGDGLSGFSVGASLGYRF